MYKFPTGKFCELLVKGLETIIGLGLGLLAGKVLAYLFPTQMNVISVSIGFIIGAIIVAALMYLTVKFMPSIYVLFVPLKPLVILAFVMIYCQIIITTWDDQGLGTTLPALLCDWRFILVTLLLIAAICLICKLIEIGYEKLIGYYSLKNQK